MTLQSSAAPTPLSDGDCYRALKARDARFDGCFFTGVTSTGIYCRPVCGVKTPGRSNCRFFRHAAQAEHAGFRPCLRCRPELAPHAALWTSQDASSILAHQAARLLDEPENWGPTLVTSRTSLAPPEGALRLRPGAAGFAALAGEEKSPGVMTGLASRLGISDRHVRRIFEVQFGVSPLQYLQTRRLLTAKQLLADTRLPITQIALMSGFASVRRFNAAFATHYHLNPTQLRRSGGLVDKRTGDGADTSQAITVRLGYRPPYDVAAMLGFFGKRCIQSMECVTADATLPGVARTFSAVWNGQRHTGWLLASFDEARCQLVLKVSDSLCSVLPLVIRRVRGLFDLDADPVPINDVLHARFPAADGLRVPGTLDGFELAVRAVLGQQVTVAAGRTLAQRVVERFGEPVQTPWPQLNRLFPSPEALAGGAEDPACPAKTPGGLDLLEGLGIVKQRQLAIAGIAQAVVSGRLALHGGADVAATMAELKELPGIGDWTAQYIAMRALRWPDAFPSGDVALQKALGVQALKHPAREAEQAATAWKPWRSYAVIRCWSGAAASVAELKDSTADARGQSGAAIKSIAASAIGIRAGTLKS